MAATSSLQAKVEEDEDHGMVEMIQTSQERIAETLDNTLGKVNEVLFKVLLFDVSGGLFKTELTDPDTGEVILDEETGEPVVDGPSVKFLVIFLALGAVFYSAYHRLVNVRMFGHAFKIVRGDYDHDEHEGDITPFRALTSALSATVGLGNIAGVALAMVTGGPGALFWMMFLGFFGMASKFHESTLAQMYRITNPDGSISGGPMFYLSQGLSEFGENWKPFAKAIAVLFAILCMGAAIGGGNMFQANQAFEGFFTTFVQPNLDGNIEAVRVQTSFGVGLIMAVIVGVVVIGGITRIGAATARILPFMATLYVGA
ncbi:MAG: alanine:cation symporter family protein, partial [Verrucomicrobiota bacterium]